MTVRELLAEYMKLKGEAYGSPEGMTAVIPFWYFVAHSGPGSTYASFYFNKLWQHKYIASRYEFSDVGLDDA